MYRLAIALGLTASCCGLTVSAQDVKKDKPAEGPVEKAQEQSKLSGLPILAVGYRET